MEPRRQDEEVSAASRFPSRHGCGDRRSADRARPGRLESRQADHDLQSVCRRRWHGCASASARRDGWSAPRPADPRRLAARRGRHARAGAAAERQTGRAPARLHEHQQPALPALPADQLEPDPGLHLHRRADRLHDRHRRARGCAVEDAGRADRSGPERSRRSTTTPPAASAARASSP